MFVCAKLGIFLGCDSCKICTNHDILVYLELNITVKRQFIPLFLFILWLPRIYGISVWSVSKQNKMKYDSFYI